MPSLNLRPRGRTLARRQLNAAAELPDPRAVLSGPLDPALLAIRADLRPYRRRLWLRRIVRRAWLVAAAVLVAEVVVFTLARIIPVELLPTIAAAIPVMGLVGLVWLAGLARPTLGETALAIDAEAHLGDRVASALALAVSFPELAAPATETASRDDDPADESLQTERFVRRQRADAAASIRLVPSNLFRPRTSRTPAAIALVGALLLAPLVLLPNSQDAAIAQAQNVREEAKKQADRIDQIAKDLEAKGTNPEDPRTRLAQELRDLARQTARAAGGPEAQPRQGFERRDERPFPTRSGKRATSILARFPEPIPVSRRDRTAERQQGRRPEGGRRRPQGARRQAGSANSCRAQGASGRAGGAAVGGEPGERCRGHGPSGRRPEPRSGKQRRRPRGPGSTR